MKIAYFTDTYLPQINGVTNTLKKLSDYLDDKSIDCMFFCPEYPEGITDGEDKLKRFKSVKFPLYPECRLSIPFYTNVCKIANSFKPDIIHLVTEMGIGLRGLQYARQHNIPLVSSFHTNFDVYLKYYNLEYLEDFAWGFFRWFHNFSLANFCPSNDTRETLEQRGIKNVKIWSRGIDADKFNPALKNKDLRKSFNARKKPLFLYVGRVAAEKDLDILTESINNVNRLYPKKSEFVIVGDGPYTNEMKKDLPENVHFTGYKKGKELHEIYATCDAFVFPSSTETFGNVVLEAMASGLPVIAVNSGGVKDSVKDGYNGIMCEPRDAGSFTKGVGAFIENPGLFDVMGKNARDFALTKSWDSIFSTLVSDYTEVVEQCKGISNKTA